MVRFCFFPFRSIVKTGFYAQSLPGSENALRVPTEQLSLRSKWQSKRLQRNNGRKSLHDCRWSYG
jgi:hypothetical protein